MGHPISLTIERVARKEYKMVLSDEEYDALLSDGTVPNLESYENDLSTMDDNHCDVEYDYRVVNTNTDAVIVGYDNE